MGIEVRHEPDIRTMAGLAYGVGQGSKNVRRQDRSDKLAYQEAQLRLAARGQANQYDLASRGLDQRVEESALSRDFDREMFGRRTEANIDITDRNQRNQLAIGEAAGERALGRDEARFGQDLDRLSFEDELTRGRVVYEYTQQQKRGMEKAAEGLAYIQGELSAGRITQGQYDGMKSQLDAMMIGTQPVPKYDDTPTGKQRFEQESFVIDEDGTRAVWEANGRLKILEPKSEAEQKKREIEKRATFTKDYDTILKSGKTTDALGNETNLTHQQVMDRLRDMENGFNQMNVGGTAQPEQGTITGSFPDVPPEKVLQLAQQIQAENPNASPQQKQAMLMEALNGVSGIDPNRPNPLRLRSETEASIEDTAARPPAETRKASQSLIADLVASGDVEGIQEINEAREQERLLYIEEQKSIKKSKSDKRRQGVHDKWDKKDSEAEAILAESFAKEMQKRQNAGRTEEIQQEYIKELEKLRKEMAEKRRKAIRNSDAFATRR